MSQNSDYPRRRSIRLTGYDYSQDGFYFVTVCTKDRKHFFGEICNERISPSEIGEIVDECWQKIPEHFPRVKLDEYVIMPNHLHGIVIIDDIERNRRTCSLQKQNRQHQKLPVIIGSFKSAVTKQSKQVKNKIFFAWQKSYYEHIVRSEKSLSLIREYILANPQNWSLDFENTAYHPHIVGKERAQKQKEHYQNLFVTT